MGVISTILYILLFMICLSVLIVVHELGHLTAAKVFKVYCSEFSIGMGPLIWKHKRKGGETQFSLRAVPFGGYVSMYGEGAELPEGVVVDESRALNKISKWKQAIILVAGVTMNAVLAIFIFFISNIAFVQEKFVASNVIDVAPTSICEVAGLKKGDLLTFDSSWEEQGNFMLKNPGTITLTDDSTMDIRVVLKPIQSFKTPIYSYIFYGYEGGEVKPNIVYSENIKSVSFNLETKVNETTFVDHPVTITFTEEGMIDCGLRVMVSRYRNSFGQALKATFSDFGHSATAVVDSLGMLVTGQVGVDQLSGIVGIGFEAKTILDDLGVSYFMFLWGLISVNLAIFNLLPFPGLDGWQLLVVIIEGITHKKVPDKVKGIFSLIGIGILLLLMAFILFKDLWVYIFKGLFSGIVL
ncbi:MAG: site-2 protease family protein [Bacilli bacterium]|nr:site-2 protease family protein [Bacilli bacterium]